MPVFIQDISTQTTSGISTNSRFTSQSIPNISFNVSSGIYNPTTDNIRIFTNNTDALTIDSNQCLYGNATGLTHLQYSNIDGKPDLTEYATNTNLKNLSSNSTLSINNLNATSTSLLNKTNFSNLVVSGASTYLSSLNVSGNTTLNNSTTINSSLNVSGILTANGTGLTI